VNDAGRRIDHRHRLPGIVGLHHRASRMPVAEHGARPLPEGGEPVAKPGEAVAVGMGGAIFLPQKRQRHSFALQLPGNPRPIRLAQILRRTAHPVKQTPFQRRIVVKAGRQGPARQPRLPRPQQIGRNRGLADLQSLCHLAHRKTLFMGQAQDRPDIPHARSSRLLPSWHGLSRFDDERAKLPERRSREPTVKSTPETVRDLAESLSAT
jgi:hypothetical protein